MLNLQRANRYAERSTSLRTPFTLRTFSTLGALVAFTVGCTERQQTLCARFRGAGLLEWEVLARRRQTQSSVPFCKIL